MAWSSAKWCVAKTGEGGFVVGGQAVRWQATYKINTYNCVNNNGSLRGCSLISVHI